MAAWIQPQNPRHANTPLLAFTLLQYTVSCSATNPMGDKEDELDIEDLKALEGLDREAKEWERDVEVERKQHLQAHFPSTNHGY